MFHIHNGDCSADTARSSTIPGEHFAFRESLVTGPAPSGLDETDWRTTRAQHLAESYGVTDEALVSVELPYYAIPLEQVESELAAQESKLHDALTHDEVVLWFEHDLFCQVNLIYLLNWFTQREVGMTQLSLICINEFPTKPDFKGLGELSSDELETLFPLRQRITKDQLKLASGAWAAFTSSNPEDIETLLSAETKALPFLNHALRSHLRRFPSTANGLGAVETCSLKLIKSDLQDFRKLFAAFGKAAPVFGLGDAQVWLTLNSLANARNPLLTINNGNSASGAIDLDSRFALTSTGESVLSGDDDFIDLNGIDLWLGGVHLDGERAPWRWDDSLGKLQRSIR